MGIGEQYARIGDEIWPAMACMIMPILTCCQFLQSSASYINDTLHWIRCRLLYHVTVRFSSDGKIAVDGNEITVSIKSRPERGKANTELIKKLSKHFSVPEGNVRIISGLTSRKKMVEIL